MHNNNNSRELHCMASDSASFNEDHVAVLDSVENLTEDEKEKLSCLQAQVFLEDAEQFRTTHHKLDGRSLKLYRLYYSLPIRIILNFTIFVLLILPFFETPSSLSATSSILITNNSNIQYDFGCGVTEAVELISLMILTLDLLCKSFLFGMRNIQRSPWLIAYYCVIAASYIDTIVYLGLGCWPSIRIRRFLRPFFLIQNSPLMKKLIKSLKKSIPEMLSALLLLFIWLLMATIFGMILFTDLKSDQMADITKFGNDSNNDIDKDEYFTDFWRSLFDLLVLLTTANNPDIMMKAYNENRLYSLFFVVFLSFGLYVLMNILTVIVYNQFRGYFQNSIQTSYNRRVVAIRAAYEVLQGRNVNYSMESSFNQGVEVSVLSKVIESTKLTKWRKQAILNDLSLKIGCVLNAKQFNQLFNVLQQPYPERAPINYPRFTNGIAIKLQRLVLSKWFGFFGTFISIVNVVTLILEITDKNYLWRKHSRRSVYVFMNTAFILYYFVEQLLKLWAFGPRGFFTKAGNIFDFFLTIVLVGMEAALYAHSKGEVKTISDIKFFNIARLANLVIIVRALRIVIKLPTMRLLAVTMVDLIRNMPPVFGLLASLYYEFALLGILLFQGVIKYPVPKDADQRIITFTQADYWANNFNDFYAALMVLWDLMIVNNWQVIVNAYSSSVNEWVKLYFVIWWLLSVVIVLNVFLAVIIENFIFRWDRYKKALSLANVRRRSIVIDRSLSFHHMFQVSEQEVEETDIIRELASDKYLCEHIPHLRFYCE